MNRKILFSLAILIVIAGAAWLSWRKGVLRWRPAGPAARSAKAHEARQLPISSEALIARALAAKEIDYETSLLYRAFALFGDSRLPLKYVTNVINLDAGTMLSSEIVMHEDQLSPATRSALAPFLARPNDPKSILYLPRNASTGIFHLPTVAAAGVWQHLPAAGGLVQVWTNSDFQLAAPLQTYVDDVNLVWPKLRELIRPPTPDDAGYPSLGINPDSAIDVYIVPLGQINPRFRACEQNPGKKDCTFVAGGPDGFTIHAIPIERRSSSAYVTINGSIAGDELVATLAHELFHTSQYSYSSQKWLAEATATWGEFRVMRNLARSTDQETQYLGNFFHSLDTEPLDQFESEGLHQYGAYLYFVFAKMERGDTVVSDIWAYTSGYQLDEAKAVDAVFPFKDHFRDFALRNWNSEPVPKLYKTTEDEGLANFQPHLNAYWTLKPNHTESLSLDLKELTARYDILDVTDKVAKLRVNLADVAQNASAGVDAIVSIANKSDEVQHWTGKPEVTFCRDDPDQRVTQVVLIVSNANLQDNLQGKIGVEPSSEPCKDRVADLTLSATYTVDADERDKDSRWIDHLVVSHSGTAHYTLLPYGTGTKNVDPNVLSTSPRSGFQADRTGVFTANIQGGGNCTGSKMRGKITWTYYTDSPQVPPNSFPGISVRLRPGEYGVDEGLGADAGEVSFKGEMVLGGRSIPLNNPGPAMAGYAFLVQQTIQEVDDAMHGKFEPYSKRFSASHRVTKTVTLPPNEFGPTGTATVDISYQLTVSRE